MKKIWSIILVIILLSGIGVIVSQGEGMDKEFQQLKKEIIGYLDEMNVLEKTARWEKLPAMGRKVTKIGKPAIPILLEILKGKNNQEMRYYYASEFLGRDFKTDEQVVPELINILRTGNTLGRKYSAKALGNIGDGKATASLIIALEDKNNDVRINSARSLGQIDDKEAVKPLIKLLDDPDFGVRIVVVRDGLRKIGGKEAIDGLIIALKPKNRIENGYGYVAQSWAAIALGELNAKKAIPALEEALRDENNIDSVKRHIAEALKKLTGKDYR